MLSVLLESGIRAMLVATGVALVLSVLRIRTAYLRHAAWSSVVFTMVLLPGWLALGPEVSLPILPTGHMEAAAPAPATSHRALPPARMAATDISEQSVPWNWQPYAFAIYLAGVCKLLLRLAIGTAQVHSLLRSAVYCGGRLTHPSCMAPVTVGFFRPRVILPPDWTEWPEAQLNAVLTHENWHARRRDPLIQWLALLNRAIFWFHPLAWWLERKVTQLAEEACDAAVLSRGCDPREYSAYLLRLARSIHQAGTRIRALESAMAGSYLKPRIQAMLTGVSIPPVSKRQTASAAILCVLAIALFSTGNLVRAQSSRLVFDVGSVKPNPTRTERGYRTYPKGIDITGSTLFFIISQAYQTPIPRIVHPPSQIDRLLTEEYDIHGKTETPSSRGQILLMLQTLLIDRFKLAVHHESKRGSVYSLVPARSGPKLKPSDAEFESSHPQMGLDFLEGHGVQVSQLCFFLTARLGRPVIDRTRLKGLYDFRLKVNTLEEHPGVNPKVAAEFWTQSSIFRDIQEQLGLRLEPDHAPIDYLVIDNVTRPSEN